MRINVLGWLLQMAIAFDQFINAFLFFGYADETLSARAWRLRHKTKWKMMQELIDGLFFWQENHCQDSYMSEQIRKQLPMEYRKGHL